MSAPAPVSEWTSIWHTLVTVAPFVLGIAGWAVRVEKALSRHDLLLERQTEALTKIEKVLEDWTEVKEQRAVSMSRLEAKMDLLMAHFAQQKEK